MREVLDEMRQLTWGSHDARAHNATVVLGTVAVIATGVSSVNFAFGSAVTHLLGNG